MGSWSPAVSLSSLLTMIRCLLESPNPDDGLMPDITAQYKRDLEGWKREARARCERDAKGDNGVGEEEEEEEEGEENGKKKEKDDAEEEERERETTAKKTQNTTEKENLENVVREGEEGTKRKIGSNDDGSTVGEKKQKL